MDIHRLEIFVNLVETSNYTRTAREMHVTQPTVTHDIKLLENEIGVRLFNRNKRHVNPTEDGLAFYKKIRPLINNYYSAVQDIRKKNLDNSAKITIGYSYTPFNDVYIPKWIREFSKLHPNVSFSLMSLNHNELKQHLLSEEIDLFVTTGNDAKDLENTKSFVLETESFKAIVPKSNPLSKKKMLELTDFENQKMLFLDNNWAAVDLINLQNKITHINRNLDITYANNLSSLNVLIKGEQGIALGLYCLYPELSPYLTYVPVDWKLTVDLVVVTLNNNEKASVRKFVRYIKKEIKSLPCKIQFI